MIENTQQLIEAVNDGLLAMKMRPLWWETLRSETRDAYEALPVYLAQNPQAAQAFLATAQSIAQKEKTVDHKAKCVQAGLPQATVDRIGTLFPNVDWAALWQLIQTKGPAAVALIEELIAIFGGAPTP